MVEALYKTEVDWTGAGNFSGANDDVSADVRRLSWGMGRDRASQLVGRSTAGVLEATLKNQTGKYNSFKRTSPLAGNILPKRKVRVLGGQWALDFDAAAEVVSFGNVHAGLAAMTLELRVKFTSLGSGSDIIGVATKGLYSVGLSGVEWEVNYRANVDRMDFIVVKDTSTSSEANVTNLSSFVTVGQWHTFRFMWNAVDLQAIYIDGVLRGSNVTPVASMQTTTATLKLGGNSGNANLGLPALVAEMRLWNTETESGMDERLDGDEAGLVGLWRIDEGEDSTISDGTANGNDGTITGATWERVFIEDMYAQAPLWTGYLVNIEPKPALGGAHEAVLRAEGPLSILNRTPVRVAPQTSILTGTAVGQVLDDAGWAAGDRDIAAGQTTMSRWWANSSALQALRDIEETEAGFLRESRAGEAVFEDRGTRMTSPHTTSQQTYSDAGADIGYKGIAQEDPWEEIYNVVRATVTPYTVGSLATLWTLAESGSSSPSIQPGATRTWWAEYPNPDSPSEDVGVDAWTTPVASTDYTANSAADGSGTDHTADLTVTVSKFPTSMKISITNNASVVVYLTLLQARGTPVSAGNRMTVSEEDATSQSTYGEKEYPIEAKFIPDTDEAQPYCEFVVSIYKDPIPVLTVSYVANRDSASLQDALAREVSDRVTVESDAATELGISEDFFIEAMRHVVEPGAIHQVMLELSPVAGYAGFWVMGTSALGVDTGLAY